MKGIFMHARRRERVNEGAYLDTDILLTSEEHVEGWPAIAVSTRSGQMLEMLNLAMSGGTESRLADRCGRLGQRVGRQLS